MSTTDEDDHGHTFVSYPAPSGMMLDTGEWVEICVHPGCMLVRSPNLRRGITDESS
jgi:hypothetical protein